MYLKGGEGNLSIYFSLLKRFVIALRTVNFCVFETFFTIIWVSH